MPLHLKIGGSWKAATAHLKVGGTWRQAAPFVKIGGVWKAIIPPVVREPATGDRYDSDNRVTMASVILQQSPPIAFTQSIFKWNGAVVYDSGQVSYPDAAPSSVTVGGYTYYTGSARLLTDGTSLYGIYREGPG